MYSERVWSTDPHCYVLLWRSWGMSQWFQSMACMGSVWEPGTDPEPFSNPSCTRIPSSSEVCFTNPDTLCIETDRSKWNKWLVIVRFFLLIQTHLCLCSRSTSQEGAESLDACPDPCISCCPADSDAHSTTSSASPAQSPCYSNQSDDGSDTELSAGASRTPVFSFLDLTYWKR